MISKFTFRVDGKPVPKARPRLGRGRRAFTPQRTLDYEALVKEACLPCIPEGWPTDVEYEVEMVFYFADRTHGDLDNHAKMLDGLNPKVVRKKRKVVSRETPFVWQDDKQVRKLTITRYYVDDEPGLVVHMEAWEPTPKQKSSRPRKRASSTSTPSCPSTAQPSKLRVRSGKSFSKHIETSPAAPSKRKTSGPTGSTPRTRPSKRTKSSA